MPIIRTGLAWRRTAMSFAAVTLLFARLALTGDAPWPIALACVIAAATACVIALLVVWQRVGALKHGRTSLNGHALLLCAILTVGYAMLGTVLMIL
ncbi:DUF202 domain-containing protein [Catenuloplanes japonicus]|uniref:DUF202 domain-containing protein n=1 Tax=Catenuloplanes japonicus TaxID=33876 RepID=UPI000A4931BD|nr:DUF202 domain-containing protein [Catenuloplanes japonicus]